MARCCERTRARTHKQRQHGTDAHRTLQRHLDGRRGVEDVGARPPQHRQRAVEPARTRSKEGGRSHSDEAWARTYRHGGVCRPSPERPGSSPSAALGTAPAPQGRLRAALGHDEQQRQQQHTPCRAPMSCPVCRASLRTAPSASASAIPRFAPCTSVRRPRQHGPRPAVLPGRPSGGWCAPHRCRRGVSQPASWPVPTR
jgi:hypothetical protein